MWSFFFDILFPRQCLGCGKWGSYICNDCSKNKIEYFDNQVCPYCEKPSPYGLTHPRCAKPNCLDGLFVLCHYRGLIPKAVHEIKYQGYYAIVSELADLVGQKYHHKYQFQYFVPVPLSKNREQTRGFNQSEKLAKELAKRLPDHQTTGLPKKVADGSRLTVVPLLKRTRETKPQFELKFEERQHNMKDAFAISSQLKAESLKGTSFCLVDDVATTGSTLFECAKVLKRAGAERVFAITIARGG